MHLKTATTVEEQIAKLEERGIIISDREKAKEILLDIGYYRLGFYLFPFEVTYPSLKHREHRFKENTKIEYAVALYYLDFDLRHILIRYLTRIEIALRTAIIYYISNKYKNSPTWFVDKSVVTSEYANGFNTSVYISIINKPVIARHHKKHINDKFAPAWKTIEFMTLGEVIVLYQNLKMIDDKLKISEHFGVKKTSVFENYLETVRVVRNLCAHGNVLFDLKLHKRVKRGPASWEQKTNGFDLKAAISVISYLLRQISTNREKEMKEQIKTVVEKAKKSFPNIEEML